MNLITDLHIEKHTEAFTPSTNVSQVPIISQALNWDAENARLNTDITPQVVCSLMGETSN